MNKRSSNRRFSILSLILLTTTLAALAGWIGAARQSQEARREVMQLRRELESYSAELGQLNVVDKTRIHAIGMRRRPQESNVWRWRVFVPKQSRLAVVAAENQSVSVPFGEHMIEAELGETSLNVSIDGGNSISVELPDHADQSSLKTHQFVGPNERSVWEQSEASVLIDASVIPDSESDQNSPTRFSIALENVE